MSSSAYVERGMNIQSIKYGCRTRNQQHKIPGYASRVKVMKAVIMPLTCFGRSRVWNHMEPRTHLSATRDGKLWMHNNLVNGGML